ncbi:MAG: heavy metal-associated domain-containing protein [Actinomycetota bacterium]|nr:heavy metal-associated domain-containing protein [Actinomycetota bacterium]MDD5668167.1 heavy metal-associated domain-containing protein [Actinomycetota bacterium]
MSNDMGEKEGLETAVFQIVGMGCSCEGQIVEKRVKSLKGVADFLLNPITNRMTLTYDPTLVSVGDIRKAVKKAGLKAEPSSSR